MTPTIAVTSFWCSTRSSVFCNQVVLGSVLIKILHGITMVYIIQMDQNPMTPFTRSIQRSSPKPTSIEDRLFKARSGLSLPFPLHSSSSHWNLAPLILRWLYPQQSIGVYLIASYCFPLPLLPLHCNTRPVVCVQFQKNAFPVPNDSGRSRRRRRRPLFLNQSSSALGNPWNSTPSRNLHLIEGIVSS